MKTGKPTTGLHIPNTDTLEEAVRLIKAEWRRVNPGPVKKLRRPSHREEDTRAIMEIAKSSGGVSSPGVELWTQAGWIDAVGKAKELVAPGTVTIKNNLKQYIQQNPFPLHLIPATTVQGKSINDQLGHWYLMAMAEFAIENKDSTSNVLSLNFARINCIHRKLCLRHIPKKKLRRQITETARQAWFDLQCNRIEQVPLLIRNPPSFSL